MFLPSIRHRLRAPGTRSAALALVAALAATGTSLPCAGVCLERNETACVAPAVAPHHGAEAGCAGLAGRDGAEPCRDAHDSPASPCAQEQTLAVLAAAGHGAPTQGTAMQPVPLAALSLPSVVQRPVAAADPALQAPLAPDRGPPRAARPSVLRI